jgi:hypothetical protein
MTLSKSCCHRHRGRRGVRDPRPGAAQRRQADHQPRHRTARLQPCRMCRKRLRRRRDGPHGYTSPVGISELREVWQPASAALPRRGEQR